MAVVVGTNQADTIFFTGVSPGVIGGPTTAGTDFVFGAGGNDTISASDGDDVVFGGAGDDFINGDGARFSGGVGDDFVDGGEGDDRIWGEGGSDILLGGDGDDFLNGAGGWFDRSADDLRGGRGADTLRGAGGADTLAGGPGADTFLFADVGDIAPFMDTRPGQGNRDVILDFQQGSDVIDLSNYQTYYGFPGTRDTPTFLGTGDFIETDALQVRYQVEGDLTIVQFLTATNGEGVFFSKPALGEVELRGSYTLTGSDFVLTDASPGASSSHAALGGLEPLGVQAPDAADPIPPG